MLKKGSLIILLLVSVVVFLIVGHSAYAATSIVVKAEDLLVQPGETFDFPVSVISIDPSSDLITSGDFDLFFSTDFIVNSVTPGPNLSFLFGPPTIGSGYVEHIEPASFSGVGPQVFAILNMTAPSFLTTTTMDLRDGGNGWGIYGSSKLANVTYDDGSINLVPEPISSILFLSGGAAPAFRSYLRKKIKKNYL